MKLNFKDLPCYKKASAEDRLNKLYTPNGSFNLSRLPPTRLRYDFAAFIFDRASELSFYSLSTERTNFHDLADFLTDTYPEMESLTDVPISDLEKRLKAYLLMNDKPLYLKRTRMDQRGEHKRNNPVIDYLKLSYRYFSKDPTESFSEEDDDWNLSLLPFKVETSLTSPMGRLSFTRIKQEGLKDEVKKASLYQLKRLSVVTVSHEVFALSHLSEFLYKEHPTVTSLKDFSRPILEDYLSYIYSENNKVSDHIKRLYNLKSMLTVIGKLYDYDNLRGIFLKADSQKRRRSIYKSYSDEELERLHAAYKFLDKQTARLLLIHESLGLRISDTLTLKTSDVHFGDDPFIRITQPKTGKTYDKKLNDNLIQLLKACIEETTDIYGPSEYIFVCDKYPDKPMRYGTLAVRIRTLINRYDLRDDNGIPFTVGTHIFRHTYGKKLCDLFNDDATIAALLGHSSIGSVSYYRQMSPGKLLDSVKPVIDKRNDKIKQFKKGWME